MVSRLHRVPSQPTCPNSSRHQVSSTPPLRSTSSISDGSSAVRGLGTRWWRWWSHWNKVSTCSPCLDDVQSNTDEGHVRVGVARIVGSLYILVASVSIKRNIWLGIEAVTLTSSFKLFYTMSRFLQPSELVVKDCKPSLCGVMPQPIYLEQLLNLFF